MKIPSGVAALIVATLALSGCSVNSPTRDGDTNSPVVLTLDDAMTVSLGAKISGTLELVNNRCFGIAVAGSEPEPAYFPPGTKVGVNDDSLVIPTLGTVTLHDRVETRGGTVEAGAYTDLEALPTGCDSPEVVLVTPSG